MKTLVKFFHLAVGRRLCNMSRISQKPTSLMMSLTKNLKPQIFFHCRLKDLPFLLGWTAL